MKILSLTIAALFLAGTGAKAQGTSEQNMLDDVYVSRPVLVQSIAAFNCIAFQNGAGWSETIEAGVEYYRTHINRVANREQLASDVFDAVQSMCPEDVTKAYRIHKAQQSI
jgi:type III secretory pathway component EscR